MAMSENPTVTIVVATYNRSEVLKHAIRSVLSSTFTNWELIVVGDGCTDDTEACVRSFVDSRIQFINLPRNTGGQAAPNNRGIELARGRYIAFLNHDDLFLDHHLGTCVGELDAGGTDVVCAPAIVAQEVRVDAPPPDRWRFFMTGVSGRPEYTPFAFYSASSWMFRRELVSTIGPWPAEDSVFVTPSQAWLFRAWRSGARLQFNGKIGVVLLDGGARRGCYAKRESPEHDKITHWMSEEPRAIEIMIENAAINTAQAAMDRAFHSPFKALQRALAYPVYSLLTAIGTHPLSLNMALRYGKRGGFVSRHRRVTGAR
jgi:glycosyltransferase involved in cell wall biosynthesis